MRSVLRCFVAFLLVFVFSLNVNSQYFGKNKPFYRTFDFRVVETSNFEIYHYFEDSSLVNHLSKLTERWYHNHQQILLDTFRTKSPLIFYENHADFQQTTAIMGTVDVGVGGVTEGLKRRVVLPMGFTNYQTNHVLGHELVHAFQFYTLMQSEGMGISSIQNIPLWMIEGMAEYLSIGSVDAQTALWMRDALINNQFPTLDEMSSSHRYSPYRFGQSFWAYVSYKYGEQFIPRLFKATARKGYRHAMREVLFVSADEFSKDWELTSRNHLFNNVNDSAYSIVGNRLITKKNGGKYNLCPSVSSDGRYIIFLSEKDVYSLELFLADAESGDIIKKVFSSVRHSDIDALNFLETSGSWSPNNRYFAFVAFSKGRSSIIIYDVEKLEVVDEITPNCTNSLSYPAWSPDGRYLAFSGQTGIGSDLYLYDFETELCENLTENEWSAIQPSWSPDGKKIWFSTEEPSFWQVTRSEGCFNIAEFDIEQRKRYVHFTFDGARNLNPVPSPDGKSVLFLSNCDGRRNLYSMEIGTGFLHQVTDYPTGITGMTEFSPALGFGGSSLFYTLLWNGEFQIIKSSFDNLKVLSKPVLVRTKNYQAARLMPYSSNLSTVEQNINGLNSSKEHQLIKVQEVPLRKKFKLDYIGNMNAGVMTGRFGTGMAGSIDALFSDILGQNLLYAAFSINGRISDFGGQVAYMNQKRRFRYGTSFSHIPYRSGYYTYEPLKDSETDEEQLVFYMRRTFEDKISLFSNWPLNRYRRLEGGLSYAFYNYQIERISDFYYGYSVYSTKGERVSSPPALSAGIIDFAYVSDNSIMGFTSPVNGHRFRAQAEQYFNGFTHQGFLLDYRKYFFVRPNTLAFRVHHYGRYGNSSDDWRMYRLYLGYPWLVRGYNSGVSLSNITTKGESLAFGHLVGSRMLVSNIEWRMPFSGPFDFALFRSSFAVSELSFFIDGGVVWSSDSSPVIALTTDSDNQRIPVFSSGLSLRFNIFGMLVLETYYAIPYHQNNFYKGEFGFNIMPGF